MINGWGYYQVPAMLRERASVKYKPTELFPGEVQRKSGFCQNKEQTENCFPKTRQINLDENSQPSILDTRFLNGVFPRV